MISLYFATSIFDFTTIDKDIARLYGDLSQINAIHIRRTDYTKNQKRYRSITENDVHEIMEKFPDEKYIIFSDDIEWCKNTFADYNFTYPPKNDSTFDDSLIEFAAMRKCKNIIMSNSTFSWWASYLKTSDGFVVYKTPWFDNNKYQEDIIPNDENWILLDEFLGKIERDFNRNKITDNEQNRKTAKNEINKNTIRINKNESWEMMYNTQPKQKHSYMKNQFNY